MSRIAVFFLTVLVMASSPVLAKPLTIVALGDSLTAGYGLAPQHAFPVKLKAALKARGHEVEIVNAGVSGDTSADGLARLDWSVPNGTSGVILELGANDALRGLDPQHTRKTLSSIISKLKARDIKVLLAGMQAPRNLGADYAASFDPIYQELAREHDVMLYPFFLEGVAAVADLNLPDGIHPTARGIDKIVANMLPVVEKWLSSFN